MNYSRQDFNKSSISYKQFSEIPPNPQNKRIYAYQSRMSDNMKDDFSCFTFTQPKFYENKIFHSTQKYNVPVPQTSKDQRQDNDSYQQFLTTHRKFTKPYGEHTKFTDTLNRNHHLLRRAQFDTPLTTSIEITSNKTNANRPMRYMRRKGKPLREGKIQQEQGSGCRDKYFDKSLSSQMTVFKRLLEKERTVKSDWIGLNNSMNRIISSEIIDSQIRGRSTRAKTQVA